MSNLKHSYPDSLLKAFSVIEVGYPRWRSFSCFMPARHHSRWMRSCVHTNAGYRGLVVLSQLLRRSFDEWGDLFVKALVGDFDPAWELTWFTTRLRTRSRRHALPTVG